MVDISIDTALIVAIVGLISSIILAVLNTAVLEPWRARRDAKLKKEEAEAAHKVQLVQLREAIYSEMAFIYCSLKRILDTQGENADVQISMRSLVSFLSSNVYRNARKDQILFYQLSDSHAIDTFYRTLKMKIPIKARDDETALIDLRWYLDEFEEGMSGSLNLDLNLLKKFAATRKCVEYLTELTEKIEESS